MNKLRPKILIAGAGQTGRNLAERIKSEWEVIIIDPDENKLEQLKKYPEIKTVKGDAASALTIRSIKPQDIDYMVVCTGNDEANIEIIDVARKEGIKRIIGVVIDYLKEKKYIERKVEIVNRSRILAEMLESKIGKGKVVVSEIGLGKGEIIEVKVLPGSILVGKKLKDIHPKKWIIGAIYRGDKLIVPHGESKIEAGDKVVIIGHPVIVKMIGDLLRTGAPEFPLQFGAEVFLHLSESIPLEEVRYIFQNINSFLVRVADNRVNEIKDVIYNIGYLPVSYVRSLLDVTKVINEEDIGMAILPPFKLNRAEFLGFRRNMVAKILDEVNIPVLFPRNTFPYKDIVLILSSQVEHSDTITEVAIDVARVFNANLSIMMLIPPSIIRDEKVKMEAEDALEEAGSVALMHGTKVTHTCLEGNPIKEGERISKTVNLLIIPRKKGIPNTLFNPDIAIQIAARANCSVIVLPIE